MHACETAPNGTRVMFVVARQNRATSDSRTADSRRAIPKTIGQGYQSYSAHDPPGIAQTSTPELHSENRRVEPALVVVHRVGTRVLERKPVFHLCTAQATHEIIAGRSEAKKRTSLFGVCSRHKLISCGTFCYDFQVLRGQQGWPVRRRLATEPETHTQPCRLGKGLPRQTRFCFVLISPSPLFPGYCAAARSRR